MFETYTQLRDWLDLYTSTNGVIQGDPATIAGEAAAAGYVKKDSEYARQLEDEELNYVDGRLVLEDDDVVKIGGRRFRFGTISGYALSYNERDKIVERIDRAIERGHNLVWLNPECVMLVGAGQPQPDRSFKTELAVGDVIYVDSEYSDERGFYEIQPAPNQNLKLVRTDG